jgi:uncharacterized protein (DUF736 family)
MATIGTFTNSGDGFTGSVKTLGRMRILTIGREHHPLRSRSPTV